MSRRIRIPLVAAVAALSVAVAAAPATASKNGPNNENAKRCQKGGWESLFTDTGGTFASEQECVSYGAMGGTLLDDPPAQSLCAAIGGSFVAGDGSPIWSCNRYPVPPNSLIPVVLRDACFADGGDFAIASDNSDGTWSLECF